VSYAVAQLDQIEAVQNRDGRLRPVRHHFGIQAFGVNAWTGDAAGDRVINEHDESEEDSNEELYVVLQGRATFELDGERLDAPAGMFVFVRPGVKRTAFAEEADTSILAVGGQPGKTFTPVGWELWGQLAALYEAGDYAQVADRGRKLVAANPQYPELTYNVACCESLAARPADAIAHLRLAIERHEGLRELARNDSDLAALRDDPAFKALLERSP
jgi:hypothetical protein